MFQVHVNHWLHLSGRLQLHSLSIGQSIAWLKPLMYATRGSKSDAARVLLECAACPRQSDRQLHHQACKYAASFACGGRMNCVWGQLHVGRQPVPSVSKAVGTPKGETEECRTPTQLPLSE
jgi:hypothetical protein